MGKRNRWASSSEDDDDDTKEGRRSKVASKRKDKKKQPKSEDEGTSTTAVAPHHAEVGASQSAAAQPAQRPPPALMLPLHNPLLHGSRRVYDCYERLAMVSEGTYGVVWKARDLATNDVVALKQIKFSLTDADSATTSYTTSSVEQNQQQREGFPVTALREINVLLALSHESIVTVKEMVVGDAMDKVFMVMEYYEFDLKVGISNFDGALFQGELKGIMQQVLSATAYMHSMWYLHRDLKPSNILVHRSGRIALADFGLARRYQDPPLPLTLLVVTLWYRAPELLFGEVRYSAPVDMWSVGCIFGELIAKDAIMQGQGELDQIDKIFSLVGVPNETTWPSFSALPNVGLFRWKSKSKEDVMLPRMFPVAAPVSGNRAFLDSNGYDLLAQLLALDPAKRLTAQAALDHPYFSQGVAPTTPRFFSSS